MAERKQKTKAFILVPQDSVDPLLSPCEEGIIIIIISITVQVFMISSHQIGSTGSSHCKGYCEQKQTGPVN